MKKQPASILIKTRHINSLWLLSLVVFIFLIIANLSGNYFHTLNCVLCERISNPWIPTTRMLSCSNVEQVVMLKGSKNVRQENTDVSGWTMWVADDTSFPGILAIRIIKDRNNMIYYPRLSGTDSSVSIYEIVNMGTWRLLSTVSGSKNEWTEIGQQCQVNLTCLEHGLKNEFEATIYFVLTGKGSQLWTKGASILF